MFMVNLRFSSIEAKYADDFFFSKKKEKMKAVHGAVSEVMEGQKH